jgi:hypothetical protein
MSQSDQTRSFGDRLDLVVLGFRSWYLNVLRVLTNFGIGPYCPELEIRAHRAANAIANFGFKGALESYSR